MNLSGSAPWAYGVRKHIWGGCLPRCRQPHSMRSQPTQDQKQMLGPFWEQMRLVSSTPHPPGVRLWVLRRSGHLRSEAESCQKAGWPWDQRAASSPSQEILLLESSLGCSRPSTQQRARCLWDRAEETNGPEGPD